ncbi:MAG: TetR/AcrR family transcriptional regulator C-terminal ligand-binding domain-containing protein [Bradyrhizobium sp.]|uniref:TetR/AcrR family transcriptional regulator n=1 Tax=Bradyrhizobium sp. TaxID=376 RepID=UPI0025C33C73|nr:TetR/AcrR family transcriptional regulator [Bradyrhizobium sp.]MBI5262981.1 TetR/AcrR family transcriptional regulator C-terminal ligand-binding domain-containing protein [Bradyrhizobium sp.]
MLRATADELSEAGLAGASVGQIAARAGVHPTSIYRQWGTPEALVLDAALTAAALHIPVPDTGSLRGDLTAFLTALDRHVRSPLGRALLALSGASEPAVEAARDRFWRERLGLAKTIFERAKHRREAAADTDPSMAIEFAIAPLYLRAGVMHRPLTRQALSRHVETVIRAFAPARARGRPRSSS